MWALDRVFSRMDCKDGHPNFSARKSLEFVCEQLKKQVELRVKRCCCGCESEVVEFLCEQLVGNTCERANERAGVGAFVGAHVCAACMVWVT
jgi:hypothetical protein